MGKLPSNIDNSDDRCIKYLAPILKLFKIDGMIIGHTPQYFFNKTGISSSCSEKIWCVDLGSSGAFNELDKNYSKNGSISDFRNAQVLEILNNRHLRITSYK